jgi:CubicO group peptidase (beta-lactamase class C family)
MEDIPCDGEVAPGFEPVAEVFAEILAEDDGAGAGFTAYVGDRPAVRLHGGWADPARSRQVRADTLMPVFSGTKGLVATCVAILIDRGLIDPDAPMATYWPEYESAGKEGTLVRQALSHQGGVPHIQEKITAAQLLDPVFMAGLIARQAPLWPPGQEVSYHALTFGWLAAELIRRADGRSTGTFLREEVTGPLGADAWLGLPESEHDRVGEVRREDGYGINVYATDPARAELLARIWDNPKLLTGDDIPWNTTAFRSGELPGGGAVASASGMARVYACLANGGTLDGVQLVSPETIARVSAVQRDGRDAASQRPLAFGLGFEVQDALGTYAPAGLAFGHTGAGGSVHGCWPTLSTSFSFAMNLMRTEGRDTRARRLLAALHACVLAELRRSR